MTLCKSFQKNSIAVRRWLVAQPHVKEESLTDWLLYRIDIERREIIYRAFSRHEEARATGADWEWWIVYPEGAMRFRVQAKKLIAGDNYPGLAYSNRHGMQIVKLLSDAKLANAYPIYALYSEQDSTICQLPSRSREGVHVASAASVDTLIKHRAHVSAANVLAMAAPLSCLVCCPLMAQQSGLGGLVDFVRRFLVKDRSAQMDDDIDGRYTHLPNFVQTFLQQQLPGDIWEQEFARDLEGIDALMVVDLRSVSSPGVLGADNRY